MSSFPRLTFLGTPHESWQDAFRPVDGVCALDELRSHRYALLGRCTSLCAAQHRALKKELQMKSSLYTCLQILSVSIFEKTLMSCALQTDDYKTKLPPDANQLILLGF